jgi:hypothetical protein
LKTRLAASELKVYAQEARSIDSIISSIPAAPGVFCMIDFSLLVFRVSSVFVHWEDCDIPCTTQGKTCCRSAGSTGARKSDPEPSRLRRSGFLAY